MGLYLRYALFYQFNTKIFTFVAKICLVWLIPVTLTSTRLAENDIPIYKGGGTSDPSNYRGIAISSCFSKLFSRILFNRIDSYIEDNNVIGHEQIGFRKNCCTSDHILTLKTLTEKAFKSSKYLFACFIDLSKAFDTINRRALFHKLYKFNVRGHFLNILKQMYASLIYSVKTKHGLSQSFETKIGVMQGCILSSTLFSLYLNDLNDCFDIS